MTKVSLAVLLGLMLLSMGCTQPEPKADLKPIADVKEVMESLVAHMAQEIFDSVRVEIDEKGTREYKPETVDAWEEVRYAALGLAESGNLLMMEGRAADQGNWKKYSQAMIDTSLQAAAAAQNQDFDGLMTAGGNIYEKSCLACHEEYLEQFENKRLGGGGQAPAAETK
jgi:hypothetical protein